MMSCFLYSSFAFPLLFLNPLSGVVAVWVLWFSSDLQSHSIFRILLLFFFFGTVFKLLSSSERFQQVMGSHVVQGYLAHTQTQFVHRIHHIQLSAICFRVCVCVLVNFCVWWNPPVGPSRCVYYRKVLDPLIVLRNPQRLTLMSKRE